MDKLKTNRSKAPSCAHKNLVYAPRLVYGASDKTVAIMERFSCRDCDVTLKKPGMYRVVKVEKTKS